MSAVSIDDFIRQKQSERRQASLDPGTHYIRSGEYAKQINRSVQTVNRMCKEGKIRGAIKMDKFWYIPSQREEQYDYAGLIAENARLKEKLNAVLSVIQDA